MGASRWRAVKTESDYAPRSWRTCDLLWRLRDVGRSDGANPKIRNHGQIADRISDSVTLSCDRQSTGGADDAHCLGVRFHARKPQSDSGSSARPASTL